MPDTTRDISLDLDDLTEDWGAMKLVPSQTGLPMAVWITENDGYQHDVRVKVSPIHGGRGSWRTAPSLGVRPHPREIAPGSLPGTDVAIVSQWIELNRDAIVAFWNGALDTGEVLTKLQRLVN